MRLEQAETLYKLQPKDLSKVGPILAAAFQHDPLWEKLLEGEAGSDQKRWACFETPIRYCYHYGEVMATSPNLEGVAGWLPGKFAEMTLWRVIRSGAIRSALRMGTGLGRKMAPIFAPLDKDRAEQMRGRSFIYLQIIGVASAFQGQGFGGKLLRALIEKSDQAGLPLYLETETENNVKWYQKFGFKVVKEISLPVIHLPMWEMVREL